MGIPEPVRKGNKVKSPELIALDARSRALENSGFKVMTDQDKLDLTQQLKQLYFHAGRWSAGARDWTARKAFEEYNRRETNANRSN